jgi:hypothetical protein
VSSAPRCARSSTGTRKLARSALGEVPPGPTSIWKPWNQAMRMASVEFVLQAYEVYHHLD